ncbi:MAG TPA: hypothetical protein VG298_07435 [Acidimicrobiales bacterium]|jgi:hypothetical protein|nr:hypothetical protein [Acidimicrobiales bacterium]
MTSLTLTEPDPHPFVPGPWRAQWIWSAAEPPAGQARRTVAFRRVVSLTEVPAHVPTRICADSRYVLWVNGREVVRGPARIHPRRRRYDVVDLASYLQPGENVVAALACFYGRPVAWWMPAATLTSQVRAGAFLLEADLGPDGWLVTDNEWRARLLAGWDEAPALGGVSGRGIELVDLRALPQTWTDLDFADDEWDRARTISGSGFGESGRPEPPNYPHGPYGARPASYPGSTSVELKEAEGVFRAERVVAGTLVVDLEGPAGAEVALTCAEFVGGDHDSSHGEPMGCTLTLAGGRRQYETFDLYGLREVHVSAPPGVTVHGVRVNERLYPVTGEAGFACSDPQLDTIWAVGRRTVSLCSHDAYVDCPTREQRAWTGDAVVHQMVDLTTNGDWRLARWHPMMAAEPGPDGMLPMAVAGDAEALDIAIIPDWALHWVHSVANLWRYLGDVAEVRRLLPVVEGVLRWFEPFIGSDGLLTDVVGWVLIDWASIYTQGNCAALNGLFGRALLEFAAMAEWAGDGGRAEWASQLHQGLVDGFEVLWDPDRRLYVDSAVGGVRRPMTSQHAQATAMLGELAPRHRWPRLVEVLTDESVMVHATFNVPNGEATPNLGVPAGGPHMREGYPEPWWDTEHLVIRAQPFFRYVIHDALAAAGRADLIPALCLDWNIALERCPTSWTETWFGGTVSHGWSSTPTRDLMVYVLGVQPDQPGFAVARIDPHLGYLDWAEGMVPCPAGLIEVRVEPGVLTVTSPIPFRHGPTEYAAGTHKITL